MGKTLGIDRETARRIKRMSRQELDGYLSRVTDRSYDNGYEEGLVNGIALAGQALDTVLKKYEADGALTALAVEEITKAVQGNHKRITRSGKIKRYRRRSDYFSCYSYENGKRYYRNREPG